MGWSVYHEDCWLTYQILCVLPCKRLLEISYWNEQQQFSNYHAVNTTDQKHNSQFQLTSMGFVSISSKRKIKDIFHSLNVPNSSVHDSAQILSRMFWDKIHRCKEVTVKLQPTVGVEWTNKTAMLKKRKKKWNVTKLTNV